MRKVVIIPISMNGGLRKLMNLGRRMVQKEGFILVIVVPISGLTNLRLDVWCRKVEFLTRLQLIKNTNLQ